jgi:hypothetical protein
MALGDAAPWLGKCLTAAAGPGIAVFLHDRTREGAMLAVCDTINSELTPHNRRRPSQASITRNAVAVTFALMREMSTTPHKQGSVAVGTLPWTPSCFGTKWPRQVASWQADWPPTSSYEISPTPEPLDSTRLHYLSTAMKLNGRKERSGNPGQRLDHTAGPVPSQFLLSTVQSALRGAIRFACGT